MTGRHVSAAEKARRHQVACQRAAAALAGYDLKAPVELGAWRDEATGLMSGPLVIATEDDPEGWRAARLGQLAECLRELLDTTP